MSHAVRCVVVDDSRFYRNVLTTLLSQLNNVEVVGNAHNGEAALAAIGKLRPDLVTLDVEMPGMNGLLVLRKIREMYPHILVIMISSATRSSARTTIEALQRGALDFIEKPVKGDAAANERTLYRELRRIVSVAETKLILRGTVSSTPQVQAIPAAVAPPDIVAVGVSTGGPAALPVMLAQLPDSFPLPVVIVQHMPPMFVSVLAESLGRRIKMRVREATDGTPLQPGIVYLAPGGRQTKVTRRRSTGRFAFELNDDAPENFCRPSIDYLFRSLAQIADCKVLAVIMTGMGRDGVEGLKLLKQRGATVLAQDESSSTVFGMPMEACKAGCVDQVLPLDLLGTKVAALAQQ